MNTTPVDLSKAHWEEVKNTNYHCAILPWGATEAHNFHLPYGTDTIQVRHIALESAQKAQKQDIQAMVLPAVPFGVNTGQMDITGTINLNPSTLSLITEDIVESLDFQDLNRLLILNGHGGNDFKPVIRELYQKFPDMLFALVNWYSMTDNEVFFKNPGDHAGEMETSNMMFIAPELVLPLEKAGNGRVKSFKIKGFDEGWVWTPREWSELSEDTGVGDPSGADPEQGRLYLDFLTTKLADFVVEFGQASRETLFCD